MSGNDGQTAEFLGAGADVEMSVDSGYTGSPCLTSTSGSENSKSDILSVSGDSTATLVQPEQKATNHEHMQEDAGSSAIPSLSTDGIYGSHLPEVTEDSSARTQKWVEESFEVFVKNLDGKTHTIPVERTEKVSVFRQKVCHKIGVPAEQQRLTSQAGRTLEDGKSLCDYDIKKHSTIYCQGRLRGGNN